MRFLSNHKIKMFSRCGSRIFLVIILLCAILPFSQIVISQNRINLASCNEHPVTKFAQILQIDPKLKDPYEPDDNPEQANPIVIHIDKSKASEQLAISGFEPENVQGQFQDAPDDVSDPNNPATIQMDQSKVYKQFHTFHSASDIDWVYFFGLKGAQYDLHAEGDGNVRMAIFSADGVNEIWHDPQINNYYSWSCSQHGYYTLKLEPVFFPDAISPTDMNAFGYTLWIETLPTIILWTKLLSGGVYGRVVDQSGKGINGIRISVEKEGLRREDITGSIGKIKEIPLEPSMIDGWFFIDGLSAGSYKLTVTKEDDPNHLVPRFGIVLSERNIERIQDIQISLAGGQLISPNDPNNKRDELEILYEIWEEAIVQNGIFPKYKDTNDIDGFINLEEFLNGTHPLLYTIECPLSTGVNLLPFYLTDQYTAEDFCIQFLNNWQSIWEYDHQDKRWQYWDMNLNGENFTLIEGNGYIIYMQYMQNRKILYQELDSEPSSQIPRPRTGIDICPIPCNPQRSLYSSYAFIYDNDPNGVKSISCYSNTKKGKGDWETTYMFFGRPAGKDFLLSPADAYVIGVKK